MQYFIKLFMFLDVLMFSVVFRSSGQTWMTGYEFRKKITFDKSKVEGRNLPENAGVQMDVPDFPVLVSLQDEAFRYQTTSVCSGIMREREGTNVAFATVTAPGVKLNFQIESYDPVSGKYRCWVKIPFLSAAKSTSPPTELYFYYGGSVLHDSYSEAGLHTWNATYIGVWHLNGDQQNLGSKNAKTGLPAEDMAGYGFTVTDKIFGQVGDALELDGQEKYLRTSGHTSTSFTLSAWVKWKGGSSTQTIAANDSINPGRTGWQLNITPAGKLELITYRSAGLSYVHNSSSRLQPDLWYHVSCHFAGGASGHSAGFYVNGVQAGNASGGLRLVQSKGYLSVGRSKDGTQYFNGSIDELHLYNEVKPEFWLKNEFQNQYDPTSFYAVGPEEVNSSWAVFTGAAGSSWGANDNWLNAQKPVAGGKVRILAGKTARINESDVACGPLVIEAGATLSCNRNLHLTCNAKLGAGGLLHLETGGRLILAGEGLTVEGEGIVDAAMLEVNGTSSSSEMDLEAVVKVSRGLILTKGKLNANGRLWLLASGQGSAALSPVLNPTSAGIFGIVNVQQFVDGAFPKPSSGRGWRLWSSPVSHSSRGYHVLDIKEHVFVTGKGGVANGFDPSPNNGATIFTHDEALQGALKDKFVPIENVNHPFPMGSGFYIFSRGDRLSDQAYRDQIQVQPFVNPGPYVLIHKGQLYIGDLTLELSNRNLGEEGDGYHLLGNPYASPIRWGNLIMENVSPFVWLYSPLNQAYQVSDDPETIIPAGAGFFVRVRSGAPNGRITFTEACKVPGF